MASITGWTIDERNDHVCQHDLRDKPVSVSKTVSRSRRVTIRIDDAPLTMTQAELREKIERGWEVKVLVGMAILFVTNTFSIIDDAVRCEKYEIEFSTITHARPPAAIGTDEWIEIVEDK